MKIKKIIAREFLIIMAVAILGGLFYSFHWMRNVYISNRTIEYKDRATKTLNDIESIKLKYDIFYDIYGIPIKWEPPKVKWEPPKDAVLVSPSPENVADALGISKGKVVATSAAIDSLNELTAKLREQQADVNKEELQILNHNEIFSRLTAFIIIIFSISFPLRFLVLSIIWAIKTIRS